MTKMKRIEDQLINQKSPMRRLLEKCNPDLNDPGACWIWNANKTKQGYGIFYFNGKDTTAHRASYQIFRSRVDYSEEVDHLCRRIGCVNPNHLEVVSRQENARRTEGLRAWRSYCHKGHFYTLENTRTRGNSRSCKRCASEIYYEKTKPTRRLMAGKIEKLPSAGGNGNQQQAAESVY